MCLSCNHTVRYNTKVYLFEWPYPAQKNKNYDHIKVTIILYIFWQTGNMNIPCKLVEKQLLLNSNFQIWFHTTDRYYKYVSLLASHHGSNLRILAKKTGKKMGQDGETLSACNVQFVYMYVYCPHLWYSQITA